MSALYTPGPWLIHATNRIVVHADGAFNDVTVKDGAVIGDDLPVSICLLRNPAEEFSEDETLANGFLIAAAPELLEAGERLLEILAGHVERMHNNPKGLIAADIKAIAMEIIDTAAPLRAAIAKAKGGAA